MRLMLYFLTASLIQFCFINERYSPPFSRKCPTILIECPTTIPRIGELQKVSVKVSDVEPDAHLTFHWTVSGGGRIVSGQGTDTIMIDLTGAGDQSYTAAVDIQGLPSGCDHTRSCSSVVDHVPMARRFDEYSLISFRVEKARLALFADQLKSEPGTMGFIVTYGRRNTRADITRRAERAKNYLVKKYGIEPRRIEIVFGGYRERQTTELWIAPTGAPRPPYNHLTAP